MRARATWATTRTSSATWPGSPAAADCVWRAAGRGARNDDTIPGHVALRMNGALDPAPERRPTVPPSCVGRHGSPQPPTRDFSGCLLSEDGLQVDSGLHNGAGRRGRVIRLRLRPDPATNTRTTPCNP